MTDARKALADRLEQTLRVMKSSRRQKTPMAVWADDVKGVEDALLVINAPSPSATRDEVAMIIFNNMSDIDGDMADWNYFKDDCLRAADAILALSAPPEREAGDKCAECSCDNPPDACNWIAPSVAGTEELIVWQPINSAPLNYDVVLLYQPTTPGFAVVGQGHRTDLHAHAHNKWVFQANGWVAEPTYWAPMPKGPFAATPPAPSAAGEKNPIGYWQMMYYDLLKRVDTGEFSGLPSAVGEDAGHGGAATSCYREVSCE